MKREAVFWLLFFGTDGNVQNKSETDELDLSEVTYVEATNAYTHTRYEGKTILEVIE